MKDKSQPGVGRPGSSCTGVAGGRPGRPGRQAAPSHLCGSAVQEAGREAADQTTQRKCCPCTGVHAGERAAQTRLKWVKRAHISRDGAGWKCERVQPDARRQEEQLTTWPPVHRQSDCRSRRTTGLPGICSEDERQPPAGRKKDF